MEQNIEDFIWDSFDELHHLFPPKVAQRLREQENSNRRLDFDDAILENITKAYRQKIEGVKTIEDMTALLSNYPYSKEYLTKAKKWIEEDKASPTMGNLLNAMGYTYRLQGEYDKALQFFQKALKININIYGTTHKNSEIVYGNL